MPETSHIPALTIGLPVYNGARYMAAAIDSMLAQTFEDFELIIADNASTDETERIGRECASRDPRIGYVRHATNLGAASNFNFTVDEARGRYFKWLAHDDTYAPTYLARCVEALERGGDGAVLAFSRRRFTTPDGQVLPKVIGDEAGWHEPLASYADLTYGQLLRQRLKGGESFPPIFFGVMRTAAVRQTGRVGAFHAADAALVPELRLHGKLIEVAEELYFQRLHSDEAEYAVRATRKGTAIWYDPANAHRIVMPVRLRLAVEHLRAIGRAPCGVTGKAGALLAWAHWMGLCLMHPRRGRGKTAKMDEATDMHPSARPTS